MIPFRMNVANALVNRMTEHLSAEEAPKFANNREFTRHQGSENHHSRRSVNHFELVASGADVLLARDYRLDCRCLR